MTQPVDPAMFAQIAANPQQYGQLTGYTEIPGYGYEFQTAGGGKYKLPKTPGADAAVNGINAARAYQPGAGPVAPPTGPGGGPSQAPNPNGFTPVVAAKGGGEVGIREGGDPANITNYVVRTPGRAATKGGMAAKGMTTQGGYNVDEQFLNQMEGSQLRMAAAQERGQIQGLEAAKERQGYMEAQKAQAEREAAVQAHEMATKQQQLAAYQAKYDKAEQDYTGFHDEKEREAESPKAKLGTFIGALSSALGALGAGLARTPNFAAEAVARHNEMQLRREEAELRVRKDNRDTMLGQLQQQMGSLDLAKSAYRAMQAKQSAMGFEMLAQKEQDQGKQQQLLQVAEMQNQQYLKWREEYVRGAEGEVTRTFQYVPGQAGSRGGYRAPTIEELKGLQELRAGEAGIGKTVADTAKALRPEASTADDKPVPVERTDKISAYAAGIDSALRIQQQLDKRKVSGDVVDDPRRGAIDRLTHLASNEDLDRDTNRLASAYQASRGKSDKDAELAERDAIGDGSGRARYQSAEAGKRKFAAGLRQELSTLPANKQRELIQQLSPEVRAALAESQPK